MQQEDMLWMGGGFVLGYLLGHTIAISAEPAEIQSNFANVRSYATTSCSDLCSQGKCDAYNCRGDCTAGCTKCGGVAAIGKSCLSCANLCSLKRCSDYNCRCTAGCTACGGVAAVGTCGSGGSTPPPPGPTPPPPTSGSSGQWFKANGGTTSLKNVRCNSTKCGEDSGSGSGGNRWETVQNGWMDYGYEVVFYATIKSGGMSGNCSGGHIGLKHGGPEHKQCSDSDKISCGSCSSSCSGKGCCCWWDSGIHNDNKVPYLEIEYPHACNKSTKTYSKINRKLDDGNPIGLRWGIYRESKGVRLMFWVDTSGKVNGWNWTPVYNYLDTGGLMPSSYLSKIRKQQNIEIRVSDVNCNDIKVHTAVTRKLNNSSGLAIASLYTNPFAGLSRYSMLTQPYVYAR